MDENVIELRAWQCSIHRIDTKSIYPCRRMNPIPSGTSVGVYEARDSPRAPHNERYGAISNDEAAFCGDGCELDTQ